MAEFWISLVTQKNSFQSDSLISQILHGRLGHVSAYVGVENLEKTGMVAATHRISTLFRVSKFLKMGIGNSDLIKGFSKLVFGEALFSGYWHVANISHMLNPSRLKRRKEGGQLRALISDRVQRGHSRFVPNLFS